MFDIDQIDGDLEVRRARGNETYLTFGGETEHPAPGEVIYADKAGNAHARRWTNRQSALSAISEKTSHALIVSEALHLTATLRSRATTSRAHQNPHPTPLAGPAVTHRSGIGYRNIALAPGVPKRNTTDLVIRWRITFHLQK